MKVGLILGDIRPALPARHISRRRIPRLPISDAALASTATALAVLSACTHPKFEDDSTRLCPALATPPATAATCGGTEPGGAPAGREVVVTASAAAPEKMACTDTTFAWHDCLSPGQGTLSAADSMQLANWVGEMSIEEKANQMRGTPHGGGQFQDIFRTLDNTQRGIRGFLFRDGPRGVNLDAPLPSGQTGGRATAFPVSMARGASFDLDLEFRLNAAMGDEMIASGQTMLLSPTINILRHPFWGRAQETYGEDPFLLGRFGSASVVGIQQYVPACAKHYAANNIENGRNTANAVMDEQTLREMYARHFEMVIKDAGVACIMAAYNPVNGAKSTQNRHLLNDLLRTDFGFKGFVMSDWWAMPGGFDTSVNPDAFKTNAAEAVRAGMDMELPWSLNYSQLEAITGPGKPLSVDDINTASTRILEQKLRFKVARVGQPIGLKPAVTTFVSGSIENNEAHIQLAEEAALKSMVLLKNENGTLPIKNTVRTVAVIGANVSFSGYVGPSRREQLDFTTNRITGDIDTVLTGDWGSSRVAPDVAKSVGPLAGIMAAAATAGTGITVVGGSTAAAAQNADFVVVVAGLTPKDEGEEYTNAGDRSTLSLDGKENMGVQDALIRQVASLRKPMVVVLQGGAPIATPWLSEVPALVMAWYPGMVGGRALGKLLFGQANFSGKLPITWPATIEDFPPFVMEGSTSTPMGYDIGYRYFDRQKRTPLFPFGYGLSYTKFDYANLRVPCADITKGGVLEVEVDVTNSGTVKGDEIVFLFASYPGTTKRRPIKELKGFYRVSLDPGVTKRVTIPVRISDLKYFDMAAGCWDVESGPVEIMVGPSSDKLMLKDTVVVR